MPIPEYIKSIRKKVGNDTIIMPCAAVFVFNGTMVLLQKRKDNLCWAIHGGSIEIGERIEDAACRELFEETGLIANKLELLGAFSGENMMLTYPNGDKTYIICICYLCNDFSGELLQETDETLEVKWFDINDLPDNIHKPDIEPMKAFIDYICQNN